MRLTSRISILLFFVLLAMSVGSGWILNRELAGLASTHAEALRAQTGQVDLAQTQRLARQALRSLKAQLTQLQARQQGTLTALARHPALVGVLAAQTPETTAAAASVLQAARAPHEVRYLLTPGGAVLLPKMQSSEEAPLTLSDPPTAQASALWSSLLEQALLGEGMRSLERVPVRMFPFPAGGTESGPDRLTLASVVLEPIPSSGGAVGVILSLVDLVRDDQPLRDWTAAMLPDRSRAAWLGNGEVLSSAGELPASSDFDAGHWGALVSAGQTHETHAGGVTLRETLRNWAQVPTAALEVRVAHLLETAPVEPEVASSLARRQEKLAQHGLSLLGMLAVGLLALGIFVLRSQLRSLRRLVRKADAISTGHLEISLRDQLSSDELGQLARSLDRLRLSTRKLLERQEGGRHPGPSDDT